MVNPLWDILVAVKAKLEEIPSHPVVDIRHDVSIFDPKIDEDLPLLVVAPNPKRFTRAKDLGFQGGTFGTEVYDFHVDVALWSKDARTVKSGLEAYCALEYAIQKKLFDTVLASVSDVFDINEGDDFNGRIKLPAAANIRLRGWSFRYRASESG